MTPGLSRLCASAPNTTRSGSSSSHSSRTPCAGELSRGIPDLPGEPDAPAGDAELQRYRRFEAIASLLDEIAARAPLALILDDLHWADRGTRHLLRHVARRADAACS